MIDVHLPPSTEPSMTSPPISDLGWPMGQSLETSIDVSRETSMEPADLGWPE